MYMLFAFAENTKKCSSLSNIYRIQVKSTLTKPFTGIMNQGVSKLPHQIPKTRKKKIKKTCNIKPKLRDSTNGTNAYDIDKPPTTDHTQTVHHPATSHLT